MIEQTDDCMAQFAREKRAEQELYGLLLVLADKNIYDEDYCQGLRKLNEIATDKSHVPYLMARMQYAAGYYEDARQSMEEAMFYRAIDFSFWRLLLKIHGRLGNTIEQYFYATLLAAHGGEAGENLPVPWDNPAALRVIGQARINPSSLPFYVQFFVQNGQIESGYGNLAGQFLQEEGDAEGYREFCGVYNPRQWRSMYGQLAKLLHDAHIEPEGYCEMPFDVMKCVTKREAVISCPPGKACIVPLAGTVSNQAMTISNGKDTCVTIANKWEFSFYRFSAGKTAINSEHDLQLAKPIWLGHDRRRKKLVLNILADGLPWHYLKTQQYKDVPNLLKFFSKGIIFDNHFSVSECTFLSLPTIETGCFSYRTQIFNDRVATKLSKKFITISEQMDAKGYYCMNLLCDGTGCYNGLLRGFDRNVFHQVTGHTYEAVDRCIEHLAAFSESDNYCYIHVSDTHPFLSNIQVSPYTQTKLDWQERSDEDNTPSVHKKRSVLNMTENQYNIRHLDRCLGLLFAYIEEHYAEDEYLVILQSDHGVSVYDEQKYLLSDNQSGAALMLRGAAVPQLGLVEELSSSLDLYPIMDRLLDFPCQYNTDGCLPKCFGGPGRKYTVSMSTWPGQTFKLCLRDWEYECRLESTALTEFSGLVDMTSYNVHIYRRTDRQEIFDRAVRNRFMAEAVKHIKSFAIFP